MLNKDFLVDFKLIYNYFNVIHYYSLIIKLYYILNFQCKETKIISLNELNKI